MKYKFLILFLSLLIYSCTDEIKKPLGMPLEFSIWGTWEFGTKIENTISFEDSICRYGPINTPFGKYHVSGDTIFIYSTKENLLKQKPFLEFKVLKFKEDSMLVKIVSKNKSQFIQINNLDSNIFYLSKIQEKESYIPPKVISYCSSYRPSLKIEIDNQQNVLFMGFSGTKLLNGYKGKLTKTQTKFLYHYLRNLPLKNVNDEYAQNMPGLKGRCLYLKYENDEKKVCSYGIGQEPKELKILYQKLSELYKLIDLEPIMLINDDFVFKQIWCGIPPPPLK